MIEWLRNLDHLIFHFVNVTAAAKWLDPVMIVLSSKYVWIPVYVLLLGLYIYHYKKQAWMVILLAIIVVSLSDSVSSKVIKPEVKRLRPNHTPDLVVRMPNKDDGHSKYGFVSSHAANAFALFVFAGLFLKLRKKHFLLLMLIPALISYSRVYLGVHYPADVVGGGLVGAFFSVLSFAFYGKCMIWMKRQAT